jgi:predicted DNA-binding protein
MTEETGATGGESSASRKKIQLILPVELDRRLDNLASRARITKSELIRQILSATIADVESSV